MTDTVFSFDVTFVTHDDLRVGQIASGCHRVVVMAPNFDAAQLVACQLVITDNPGVMATAAFVRI
jgi:hypothetical protein